MHLVDDTTFASAEQLAAWCDRVGREGYRGTGSAAHERVISWIEEELATLPGVVVRRDEIDILGWHPVPEGDLVAAGGLRVVDADRDGEELAVAGAVPYSAPTVARGPVVHVPAGSPIDAAVEGRIVLRDFPDLRLPYELLLGLGTHLTPDADALRGSDWDRPGLADSLLHADLLAAGAAGAAGVVFAFDLPREQLAGYVEPHKGTHHRVPAVFVGVDERERLRALAATPTPVEISVRATVGPVTTRNVIATLPGRTAERVVLVTHTDGATWVQENGVAALLGIARFLADRPLAERTRTIELAFTTAHLHISREGAAHHAAQLDAEYDRGDVAYAFALEHLGAVAVEPVPRDDGGPGRRLAVTADAEPMLWAVGPSDALQRAVVDAVTRRDLERVVVAPGFGGAVEGQVPRIVSFGGLGTYYHSHLVPTTSIITGPWSLWAPSFGAAAIDIDRYRAQTLAALDVVLALDDVPRDQIAGGYLADRAARAAGAPWGRDDVPPEVAPG